MENISYLAILVISLFVLAITTIVVSKKSKSHNQINRIFVYCLLFMMIWTFSLILQITFQKSSINPVFFEGMASFGACFIPVEFMFLGIVFSKTRITFKKIHLLLFVIPLISTILMFFNDYHHLFYVKYSTIIKETVFGPYFYVHSVYSYACLFIGLFYLLKYSIKNSGFFSKQSVPVLIGTLVPVATNIMGTLGLVNMSIYVTPISFTISMLCFAFAIFKFDFLKIAPIALQRVVDRMSDSYLVIDDEYKIIDFNEPFVKTTKVNANALRNMDIFVLLVDSSDLKLKKDELENALNTVKNNLAQTVVLEKNSEKLNKFFNIEISSISSNNSTIRFFNTI